MGCQMQGFCHMDVCSRPKEHASLHHACSPQASRVEKCDGATHTLPNKDSEQCYCGIMKQYGGSLIASPKAVEDKGGDGEDANGHKINKDGTLAHDERCTTCPKASSLETLTAEMREKFLEIGADLEHERWSGWMKYMLSRMTQRSDGTLQFNDDDIGRWMQQMMTAYKDLPEYSKESDRKEVRSYFPILDSIVTESHTLGKKAGEQSGYEEGYIEGQKHAFGVDRERVREEGKKAGREEMVEETKEIIEKHNARILNEFQAQGTASMPFIAYDERVCLIPAMTKATEETFALLPAKEVEKMKKYPIICTECQFETSEDIHKTMGYISHSRECSKEVEPLADEQKEV